MSLRYRLPTICAKCGNRQGTAKWKIESRVSSNFYIVASVHKSMRFEVPVCPSCKQKLEKSLARWQWFLAIGFSLIGLAFVLTLSSDNVGIAILSLLGMIPMMIALIYYRGKVRTGTSLGEFDGEYFYFKNENFYQKFEELNPDLV